MITENSKAETSCYYKIHMKNYMSRRLSNFGLVTILLSTSYLKYNIVFENLKLLHVIFGLHHNIYYISFFFAEFFSTGTKEEESRVQHDVVFIRNEKQCPCNTIIVIAGWQKHQLQTT